MGRVRMTGQTIFHEEKERRRALAIKKEMTGQLRSMEKQKDNMEKRRKEQTWWGGQA
jgi:hypothetical protein